MVSGRSISGQPVVVVGGSLAGMAAAARLAKAGHRVVLLEATDRLGGRAAAYESDGVRVDDLPAVIGFPAPIRDLFRKSGRPLEAELARAGAELVPAGPIRLRFADGAELSWPSDRGKQFETLEHTYGLSTAHRWRDLLDRLDDVWQVVRRTGLERELRDKHQLSRPVRQALLARRTLTDLAGEAGHPHLTALLRSTAFRLGADPDRTPAFVAATAAVERTFGRWRMAAEDERNGLTSVLVDALAARLATRKVEIRLGVAVQGLVVEDAHVTAVRTTEETIEPAAVVATVDPWQLVADLLPRTAACATRRGLRRLAPAAAPTITHRRTDPVADVDELVELDARGCPRITWTRPTGVATTHDHARSRPDPGAGAAWEHGFADWLRRPAISTEVAGLFAAGPASRGGGGLSAVLLSGALASYGAHDLLSEESIDAASTRTSAGESV